MALLPLGLGTHCALCPRHSPPLLHLETHLAFRCSPKAPRHLSKHLPYRNHVGKVNRSSTIKSHGHLESPELPIRFTDHSPSALLLSNPPRGPTSLHGRDLSAGSYKKQQLVSIKNCDILFAWIFFFFTLNLSCKKKKITFKWNLSCWLRFGCLFTF